MFEVARFHSPSAGAQELAPAANRPRLPHVAFKVDDVRGVVDRVREAGWDTVGRSSASRTRSSSATSADPKA
jgi:catechol 2,3-dioxygenase-like lactoylglutathione lyase family enzyme